MTTTMSTSGSSQPQGQGVQISGTNVPLLSSGNSAGGASQTQYVDVLRDHAAGRSKMDQILDYLKALTR